MNEIPTEIEIKIALKLTPFELLNFCLTERKRFQDIWQSKWFWRQKLEEDYPEEFLEFYTEQLPIKRIRKNKYKERYIERYTEFPREIRNFYKEFVIKVFGKNFSLYLNPQYFKDFEFFIFKIYIESLLYDSNKMDEIFVNLVNKYKGDLFRETVVYTGVGQLENDPYRLLSDFIDELRFISLLYLKRRELVKKLVKKA